MEECLTYPLDGGHLRKRSDAFTVFLKPHILGRKGVTVALCFSGTYPPVLSGYAHFIPTVGVGRKGAFELVRGDLPRQHSFGFTLTFTGPVSSYSRQ